MNAVVDTSAKSADALANKPKPFHESEAHVDEAAVKPLPNSRKVYVQGSHPNMRTMM